MASSSLSRHSRHASLRLKTAKIKSEQQRRRDRKTNDLLKGHTTKASANGSSIRQDQHRKRSEVHSKKKSHVNRRTVELMDVGDIDVIDLRTPASTVAAVATKPMLPVTVTTNNFAQLSLTSGGGGGGGGGGGVPAHSTSPATAAANERQEETSYQCRTLTSKNGRLLILPAFPTPIEDDHCPHLLLANVPDHLLSEQERNRRRCLKFRPPFHVIGTPPMSLLANTNIPSFFWPIYGELFADVSEHLHVDMAIIDYNYARLSRCLDLWSKERIMRFNKADHEVTLNQHEYAIALEFYLQVDVDLFYMKTCSFRGAQQAEPNKYLFCWVDPIARYEMTACGNCGLCYPKYDVEKRRQPSVEFGAASRKHQFVSKYEIILNCPCTCETSNIIYVLTCPCGQYDYIGETGATLADRLEAHRFHGNRIMHETFLSEKNIKLAYPDLVKSAEMLCKESMLLYRHSTECPAAVQMFLDQNPRYWRFVPMSDEEASRPEQTIHTSTIDLKATDVHDDRKIELFIQNLPTPPPNFRFSPRQYHLQYAFFKSHRNLDTPKVHLDLYNAKIIAVLPEQGSTVLRQLVESLLITHADTPLNSSGRLAVVNSDSNQNADMSSNQQRDVAWCANLVRRPLPSLVTTTMQQQQQPQKT